MTVPNHKTQSYFRTQITKHTDKPSQPDGRLADHAHEACRKPTLWKLGS
jgi:hypothetical protein